MAGMVRFALIFLQGVVLVKGGVPIEIVGQIELVFFLANFMLFYWQNGGRNAMLSWVPAKDSSKPDSLKLASVFVTMHGVAFLAAILTMAVTWLPFMERFAVLRVDGNWILLALYVMLTLPTIPLIYAYLMRGQLSRIIWYISLSYMVQVASVAVPVLLGYEISVMIRCLVGFAILRYVFVLFGGGWFKNGLPAISRSLGFIVFAIPLILHALSSGLMDFVDGWIVSLFYGDEMFAIYRFGAKEFPLHALLIGGLLTGLIPLYRKREHVAGNELKKEIRRLMHILFPICCVLLLISPWVYRVVYSSEYVLSARIFNIYALTLASRVVINQVYLYVYHYNWTLSLSTMAEIVVNVVLSVLLMREMGILGIPLATVIAYTLHRAFIIAWLHLRMRVPVSDYLPIKGFVLYCIAMLLCFAAAEILWF
jgi:O-antigen/teichoic acid export membrane protein